MVRPSFPNFDPKLVTRLVVRREIFGLGREALWFTSEEIQAFLYNAYGHNISLEEARKLADTYEGWITAIILSGQVGDPLASIARVQEAVFQRVWGDRPNH